MKINVEKTKPVVQAKTGDIAYFDSDYWLIGSWDGGGVNKNKNFYFTSLTKPNSTNENMRNVWINNLDLTSYLESIKAVIYDGSMSKLDLVIKEPKDDHD